jgi:biotin operon repressor
MAMTPETSRLLKYLRKQGSVSAREAMLDLNIGSTTKAIHRLREAGFEVQTHPRTNPATGQSYARYYLIEK